MSTDLATLKRRSLAARGAWQLIRIAVLARSAGHAFKLAERLGWSIEDCHSTAALAKIYFTYGQQAFEHAILGYQGANRDLLCLCTCHRSNADCDCCVVFACDCLCACHECADCDGFGWTEEGEACEAQDDAACDGCEAHHDAYELNDQFHYGHPTAVVEEYDEYDDEDDDYNDDDNAVTVVHREAAVEREAWIHAEGEPSTAERVAAVAARLAQHSSTSRTAQVVERIGGDRRQAMAHHESQAIQITRELAEVLSDDELAFVLAHEFAHFEHDDHQRSQAAAEQLADGIVQGLRLNDDRMRSEGKGLFRRVASAAVLGTVGTVAGLAATRAISREHETEADLRALDLTCDAGYDPAAAPKAMVKLHGGRLPRLDIMSTMVEGVRSTHPLPDSRTERLADEAKKHRHPEKGPRR